MFDSSTLSVNILHLFVADRLNALLPCGFMFSACQQGTALCSSYTSVQHRMVPISHSPSPQ